LDNSGVGKPFSDECLIFSVVAIMIGGKVLVVKEGSAVIARLGDLSQIVSPSGLKIITKGRREVDLGRGAVSDTEVAHGLVEDAHGVVAFGPPELVRSLALLGGVTGL
jgi:hypothetical protein